MSARAARRPSASPTDGRSRRSRRPFSTCATSASPAVFEVDGQILKDLDKDLFDLQDKSLVHADREAVRKVVFEQPPEAKIVVARKKDQAPDAGFADETFTVVEPKQAPAKKWKV